jgi:hypothetical protein
MDASQYLRRKRESMSMFQKRPLFQDAGQRTEMLGMQAATYKPATATTAPFTPACCTSSPAQGGSSVEAIKPTTCCTDRSYLYTAPGISTPCCPFPSTIATYLSPCKVQCYQGTTAQQATAVARRVNKEMGYSTTDCCGASNGN